jgi:WD40 repeat protein
VGFTPDGSLVTAWGEHGPQLHFWNLKTGQESRSPLSLAYSGKTAISRDGQTVAVSSDGCAAHVAPCPQSYSEAGGSGSRVRLYNTSTSQQQCVVEQADDSPYNVAFDSRGTTLALSGFQGAASLWDARSCQLIARMKSPSNANVTVVAISPNGNTLAGGGTSEYVDLWNIGTHQLNQRIATGQTHNMRDAAFSPDGRVLATASNDGTVRLWDTATLNEVGAPIRPDGDSSAMTLGVSAIAFNPDGTILAAVSGHKGVSLWDVRTGQAHNAPESFSNLNIGSIAFSLDGTTLVGSYVDNNRIAVISAALT